MLTIQDLGMQILNHTPQKFYIFGGTEHGIKTRYLEELAKHYGESEEHTSVSDLISLMNTRHIIPLKPKLYIVRYDDVFQSQISEKTANRIKNTNILGTIVCIYSNPKVVSKMDKFLPEYTATIDAVSPQFVFKYLKADFPDLPDRLINVALKCSTDYGQAKSICNSMTFDTSEINKLQDSEIERIFGYQTLSTQTQIRQGIAARNFNYLLDIMSRYDGELDSILYSILQTMIDIDKLMTSKFGNSDIRDYVKLWKPQDVYYMFMHTYDELKKLRSNSSYDISNSLIYLFGLLKFQSIPSIEEMKA